MMRFGKISAIAMSALLAGTSIAAAANYPAPFVSGSTADVAVVYGTGVGVDSSDLVQATNIQTDLEDALPAGTVTAGEGAEGETEDEVPLGDAINFSGSKIETEMDDDNIPSLLSEKISWDDGNGADDHDVKEYIVINNVMKIITTLDDEDLDGPAMTNEMALEYRYVFEDALNYTAIGGSDADDLFLDIMGQSYEISDMDADSITVSIADEYALRIGESVVFDGKTFTVDDIFSDSVQVNGEMIDEGSTEKLDGVRVEVDTVGYHSNAPESSKCILKIGEDISKTYEDGEEYIGEDDDDPLWVWTISNPNATDGYIGVKYNAKLNDATDEHDPTGEMVKYVGDSYVFPEDFAVVSFDGLTDVDYEEVMVYFDEVELYNLTDSDAATQDDVPVVVIEADSTESITVTDNDEETSKIALFWAANDTGTMNAGDADGALEVFYYDHDGDYTPSGKYRFAEQVNATDGPVVSRTKIAVIEVGDTVVDVDVTVAAGELTITFEDPLDGDIDLNVTGSPVISETDGELEQLGGTAEDADANDVIVNGTDVSTKDADIMNYYGINVVSVEDNADSDEFAMEVPSDQVFAVVSALGTEGSVSTSGSALGDVVVKDSEVSSVSNKNLVVVGGSCINSVAANILGAGCGAAFTSATDVGTGQFLIESVESPYNAAKVALVVAGYEAADTVAATQYLTTQTVDTSAGTKYIGTGATSAEMVVA